MRMKIAAAACLLALAGSASAHGPQHGAAPAPAHAAAPAAVEEEALGATLAGLLEYARQHSPEFAAMRHEAEAAETRGDAAGALPDPRFRTELRDITRMGAQNPTLSPSRVGSTRYLLMQDLPWYGKRDLRREIAEQEAEAARGRSRGSWVELAARIKSAYAQLYFVTRNLVLTREMLDLMRRLEQIAQVRYASGLAAQQDVVRAQVEQTGLQAELLAMEAEEHHLHARLNALLARPPGSRLAAPAALAPLPAPARLEYAALAERAQARNPQLAAEDARIRAAEKSRDLTYKNRYPDVTVGVSPIQYQSAVMEWELMFELNIPLQQGARRAQERESEAMLSAARSRKEIAANQTLADLAENLASIEAARRAETLAATSLLPQAELVFQSALAGYETGKVDFATLLDAQRQIRQGRQTRLRAETEARARLADVEKLLGEEL